jgi:hypothetical protein
MACGVLELCLIATQIEGFKRVLPNMTCCALELCLIATKIEGFKSLLPKYGMRCT